jgi:hypothetical protein
MKISFWDILSILLLLATGLVIFIFMAIYNDPNSALNPFQPPTPPSQISLPTLTATLKKLPPTWTPTPSGQDKPQAAEPTDSRPSATAMVTNTQYVIPTFTTTPTRTPTATPTRTPTRTPTVTKTRTSTPITPTATQNMTATMAVLQTQISEQQTATAQAK